MKKGKVFKLDYWIMNSMLDSDLYKFTQQQVVFNWFPDKIVEYEFKLRNYPNGTLDPLKPEIDRQIDRLCRLRFRKKELEYLAKIRFFKPSYLEYLRTFQLNRDYIKTWIDDKGEFRITIKGPWVNVILFETPVLAIVSEVFARHQTGRKYDTYMKQGISRLNKKIALIEKYNKDLMGIRKLYLKLVDFGARRRFSREWHELVVKVLKLRLPDNFVGTSNVWLAMKYDLKPIGTMAHEFIQAAQALTRLADSQKYAFDIWAREYRGDLGIALSDCLGFDAFLTDFDMYFCKLFDGARHDSGDPIDWGNRLIKHYESMGIDPSTKTAVFSDGLDFQKAIDIHKQFEGSSGGIPQRIKCSFGIGTNITNDTGFKAPQIVIKMTECNGQPVAKISDSKGKMMCKDTAYLKHLARTFGIKKVWRD